MMPATNITLFYCWASLILFVLIVYHNSLYCGFVFDDMSAVRDNKDIRPDVSLKNIFLNDFWGTPMNQERSHKSYRPLCILTFRLNYLLGKLDPFGYHLVNIILHGVVSLLIFCLGLKLGFNYMNSFLSSLLFSVHPIHTEAVTGIVGRAEILSSIFYISSFLIYESSINFDGSTKWKRLFLTSLFVTAATLSKEQGITIVAVCCVYEVFFKQKVSFTDLLSIIKNILFCKIKSLPKWFLTSLLRSGFLVASTFIVLLVRVKMMGGQLPVFTQFDNPAAASSFPSKQLTYNYMLPINAWLLLCPSWLCCDWTMGTIPVIQNFSDFRNLYTIIFYICFSLICTTFQSGPQNTIIFISLIVFPFIPASNLFFPVGFVVAERILYMPSIGYCFLVVSGFQRLLSRYTAMSLNKISHKKIKDEYKRRWMVGLLYTMFTFTIIVFSLKTYYRNFDWNDEYSIFSAGLRVNSANAKLFNNVGHSLESEKKLSEGLRYFKRAAQVQPDDIGAHINVGRTYSALGLYTQAENAYRIALSLLPPVKPGQSYNTRLAPNHLNVFINLGNLLVKNSSRLLEVDALLRTAISMRYDFTQAYINRGDVLMRLNRTEESKQQYLTALNFEPDNPDIYYNLGVVSIETNKKMEALKYFNQALNLNPEHKQTLFNSAVLIQELGLVDLRREAIRRLLTLLEIEKNDEKIYFNLAMLSMDVKDFPAAKTWFEMAINLKADFRSALFNLALLLSNDMNKHLEAIPHLKQLLKFHPQHINSLILLGDIALNHLKDLNLSRESFKKILTYDPTNVQAAHNLCVVQVEGGDIFGAEKCLVQVQKMAPKVDYVARHLEIIRTKIRSIQKT